MNFKFLNISIIAFIFLVNLNIKPIQAQPINPKFCDTCIYKYQLPKTNYLKAARKSYDIDTNGNIIINYFAGCTDSAAKKAIYWVHGLDGGPSSWAKPKDWALTNYKAASEACSYSGYEQSMLNAAGALQTSIYNHFVSTNNSFPMRCNASDFVIAHSQGGIATRYLDYLWDTELSSHFANKRYFNGVVTFSTPNAGAHVVFSKDLHATFISKIIKSVVLFKANEAIYDYSGKLSPFIGNKIVNAVGSGLEKFILENLAPVVVASLHSGSMVDMKPGGNVLNKITNHASSVHRVAFVAEEEAPEVWRILDDVFDTSAGKRVLFKADSDSNTMIRINNIRNEHTIKINEHKNDIKSWNNRLKYGWFGGYIGYNIYYKFYSKAIVELVSKIDARTESMKFLNDANNQWRNLIGSTHPDSFTFFNDTTFILNWSQKLVAGSTLEPLAKEFKSFNDAKAFYDIIKNKVHFISPMSISSQIKTTLLPSFFPSDGVVLCKSQIAYPHVKKRDTDLMPKTNHFQVRNCSETKIKLENLYKGDIHDVFFKTLKK